MKARSDLDRPKRRTTWVVYALAISTSITAACIDGEIGSAGAPSGGATPAPGGGMTPAPGGGMTPAPGGGMTPVPGGGMTPAPGGGMTPAPGGGVTPGTPTAPAPGRLFHVDVPWYRDISAAPVDRESEAILRGLAARGGWGTGKLRVDFSIEVLNADASTQMRPFQTNGDFYEPDCDHMPVPVPFGGRIEGESNYACASDGDCHLIVVQGMKLFEMWRANITGGAASGGSFSGGCLAVWELNRNYWSGSDNYGRGNSCTSADAAGLPMADLLFDADEVKAGAIEHAIRFILPNDRIRKGELVRPATHSGVGPGTPTPDTVPYGARLRLKAGVNLTALSPGARVVAKALQKYGMILSDGGNIALTAESDSATKAKWAGLLDAGDLGSLRVEDFEMVDGGARVPVTFDCERTP
jgi:hypothetical protein